MRYSKEMLVAHKQAVENYEKFIYYMETTTDAIGVIRDKAHRFHRDCLYCNAASVKNCYDYDCNNCVLGSREFGCQKDADMWPSFQFRYFDTINGASKESLIDNWKKRLDAIVLMAEFNISEW